VQILPQGCETLPDITWSGQPQRGIPCGQGDRYETAQVQLAEGQSLTGVSIRGIPFPNIDFGVWLDLKPAPVDAAASVNVSGHPCWPVSLESDTTEAGLQVTNGTATLGPFDDPACQHGDITISIAGRESSAVSWERFWARHLHPASPAGISSDFNEVMIPPFLGIGGIVLQALEYTSPTQAIVPDGSVVTAYLNDRVCGSSKTRAVSKDNRQNLFELIVAPDSARLGCWAGQTSIGLCVDNKRLELWPGSKVLWPLEARYEQPAASRAGALIHVIAAPASESCPVTPAAFPDTGGMPSTSDHARGIAITLLGALLAALGAVSVAEALRSDRHRVRLHAAR
jgi:hypothetical protein